MLNPSVGVGLAVGVEFSLGVAVGVDVSTGLPVGASVGVDVSRGVAVGVPVGVIEGLAFAQSSLLSSWSFS